MEPELIDWNISAAGREALPAFVYVGLNNAIRYYRGELLRSASDGYVPYVAWVARNVLELRIWIEYCSMSTANALEFYDDATRDLADVNRKGMGKLSPETKGKLLGAMAALPKNKSSHEFKSVKDAAIVAKMTDIYEANCKILSKFVHPTAVSVLTLGESNNTILRDEIVQKSVPLADEALAKLGSSLLMVTYRKIPICNA
jgi:hypothetical protein